MRTATEEAAPQVALTDDSKEAVVGGRSIYKRFLMKGGISNQALTFTKAAC